MLKKISQNDLKTKFQVRLNCLKGDMTQDYVAKKTGISRQNIAKYLIGECLPNTYTLYLLANFFGVSCDYLLGLHDGTNNDTQDIIEKTGLNEDTLRILEKFNTDDEWKFEMFAINSLIKYEQYNGRKFLVSLGKYISSPDLDSVISEGIYSLILPKKEIPEATYIGTKNNDFFVKKEFFKTDEIIYYQMIKEFNLILNDIKNNPRTKFELLKHIIDIVNPYYDEALDCLFNDGNFEDGTIYDKVQLQHAMETYLEKKLSEKIIKENIRKGKQMFLDGEETPIDDITQSDED